MKCEKTKALALLALGLTGLSLACIVGFTGAVTPKSEPELRNICTQFFLFGMLGGIGFISLAGLRFDRIKQRELADLNYHKNKKTYA